MVRTATIRGVPLLTVPVVVPGTWGGRPQPTLHADGIALRAWSVADAPAVRAAYDDPAIRRWHARSMADDAEAAAWIETRRAGWTAERLAEWAIVMTPTTPTTPTIAGRGPGPGEVGLERDGRDDPAGQGVGGAAGLVVGRAGLNRVDLHEGIGTLAYWVVPAARRRGVAVLAAGEVLRWAFDDLGLHRVEVAHSTLNLASCRVAERLGCRAEGVRRSEALHADGHHDMHVHARLATDPAPPPLDPH